LKNGIVAGLMDRCKVKMGKLFKKILLASQDRVMKVMNDKFNSIKEAEVYDTPNGVQIARADSFIFGETLFGDGQSYTAVCRGDALWYPSARICASQ
jgi:hypothetical protein